MVVVEKKPDLEVRTIPAYLAYEEMNGEALPYKGYLDVLAGNKKPEEIMGSSSLQGVLITAIIVFIASKIDRKKYRISSSESGLHLDRNNNLANDIAIFEKIKITLNDKYFQVAPKVVIEVDTKIELGETSWDSDTDYVMEKSQKMLDFGVERIIWISTRFKKILIASPDHNWYYANFDEDILLLDDCVLNLARLLMDEEIEY